MRPQSQSVLGDEDAGAHTRHTRRARRERTGKSGESTDIRPSEILFSFRVVGTRRTALNRKGPA
jgi:hypothetical protein